MEAERRSIPWPLLAVGAAAIAGGLGYSIGASRSGRSSERSYLRESEERVVNRALDEYGHGKVSREDLRKSFDINLVYLPDMTCVGFNLLPMTAGGDETICFDKSGERLILEYRNGD